MVYIRRADLLPNDELLREGYKDEESGFMTVDLRNGPKSVLSDLVREG